ncbi:MAG: helix-turn-helix domain-containing protein [Terrimicrobiaceae bacterium]
MQSIQRAVQILYMVAGVEDGCTVQQMAHRLGLKPNTVYKFTRALEREQLLHRRTGPLRFLLGPAVTELKVLDDERHLLSISGEVLVRTQARLPDATLVLSELRGSTVWERLSVQPTRPGVLVRHRSSIMPIYERASSLLFLAYSRSDHVGVIYSEHPFDAEGRAAWRSRDRLDAFLARVRRLGYCQPPTLGPAPHFRVAAPVFSSGHDLVASVAGFIVNREPVQHKQALVHLCREAAKEITSRLAEPCAA